MKTGLLSIIALSGFIGSAQIIDQPVTSAHSAVTLGGNTTITLASSQIGYNYILRDDSDNTPIAGLPELGTGGPIEFNTGAIPVNMTYNILVSNAITLNFNSDGSRINFGTDTRSIDKEITVAAWIKTASPNGQIRNIVQQYNGAQDAGYVLRLGIDGKAHLDGREQTSNYRTSGKSTTIVSDNQWHYLVGTINLNTGMWSIYVDGEFENGNTYPAGESLITTNTELKVGGVFSSSRCILGDVRDVTIWNTELLESDITTNFSNCITGTEANVVAHFPINEGQGNIIFDYSSTGINGTPNVAMIPYPWKVEDTGCRDSLELSQLISVTVSGDILAQSITVEGAGGVTEINNDLGTLQMSADLLPVNALNSDYTWSIINGTGSATISSTGLLSAVNNGTVTVKATADDISGTSGTAIITINNQTIGVDEIEDENINIYPNPVKNELFVEVENTLVTKMNIIDFSGKLIQSISNPNSKSIDVSSLNQGIYILEIYSENNILNTRFIKE